MDKRFIPLTSAQALEELRTLVDGLAADPAMPIPAVVRKIRTALRLTSAEEAKSYGASPRTLQDIERGESIPTLAAAEKVLRPMGMVISAAPGGR